jgi:anti-sigma factor RsiW
MSGHPTFEQLEAFALGESAPAEVEAHAARCPECARELAWLRTEARLLRNRQQPPLLPEIWRRVDERVHAPIPIARGRRWRALAGAAVAVAAAAALAVIVRPGDRMAPAGQGDASVSDDRVADAVVDPNAEQALDRAAGDYRTALNVLEQEYSRARARLDPRTQKRWDHSFARARTLIDASAQARNDPDERLKLLDGSAVMVRSLRHAIADSEEDPR